MRQRGPTTVGDILLFIAVALLVTACTRIQFTYNQLDWILPYYVEGYFDFTEAQSDYLRTQLDSVLTWHCSVELAYYSALLLKINADFQAGTVSSKDLDAYGMQLKLHWEKIMDRFIPVIIYLAKTMSDAQVEQLFEHLSERNAELEEEYRGQSRPKREHAYRKRAKKELERWFGTLQPTQQTTVAEWSSTLEPLHAQHMRFRLVWQRALHILLYSRNESDFDMGMAHLLANADRYRTADYQAALDHNWHATTEMVAAVGRTMNSDQKRYLSRKVKDYRRDLDQLACSEPSVTMR